MKILAQSTTTSHPSYLHLGYIEGQHDGHGGSSINAHSGLYLVVVILGLLLSMSLSLQRTKRGLRLVPKFASLIPLAVLGVMLAIIGLAYAW